MEKSFLKTLDMHRYSKMYLTELLETLGCEVTLKDVGFPLYDLEVLAPDKKTISTITINQDAGINDSDTVAVVIAKRVNGRVVPVGLLTTKAEYYMIKIYGTLGAYCLETKELLKMYEQKNFKAIMAHPDDPDTQIVLFDRNILLDRCERIIAK